MSKQEPFVEAAIDFGTTFSGWAYVFRHDFTKDDPKIIVKNWNSGQNISPKAPTSVLISPGGKSLVAFGYEAEDEYATLIEEGTHAEYYFFQRFKMMLYKQKIIGRQTSLADASGKRLKALKVFELAIRYLKDDLLESTNTKSSKYVAVSDVHWSLTVPAIWSERAKKFMREAAVNAGIDNRHLSIVLEPEAASVFCRELRLGCSDDGDMVPLGVGDRYIVVDCGGGTVDICCHEISSGGRLKELTAVKGEALGGTSVDLAFENTMAELFGEKTWSEFKRRCYGDHIDFMRQFEINKRKITPGNDRPLTFQPPNTFVDVHLDMTGSTMNDTVRSLCHANDVKIAAGNKIRLSADYCRTKLFSHVTEGISSVLSNTLENLDVKASKAILLVGGFGESEMIQNCIRQACPDIKLIVPNEAGLVVIRGAVALGYNTEIIEERVVRYTYGKREILDFDDTYHNTEKILYPDGVARVHAFKPLIHHGEIVPEDHFVEMPTSLPVREDQSDICVRLYAVDCNDETPRVVDDPRCIKLGKIVVPITDRSVPIEARLFSIRFRFGASEVSASVRELSTGNVTEGVFDFLG